MIKTFLYRAAFILLFPVAALANQNMVVGPQSPHMADLSQQPERNQPYKPAVTNQSIFVQQSSGAAAATESYVPAGSDEIVVLPEITQIVEFSNTAFNRVRCFDTVQDVVASEEKLLDVRWAGNSAFIKFMYLNKDGKPQYTTKPIELSIVCGGEIYTIIAVPKSLPSSPRIRLSSGKKKQILENASIFSGLELEKKERRFVEFAYKDDIPTSFDVVSVNTSLKLFKELDMTLLRTITATGEGLRLKEFKIVNSTKDQALRLTEPYFLKTEITSKPVFIALSRLNLNPGENARLFIVEMTGGGRELDQR